jgi:uncharacterized membrane protein
VTVYSIVKAIHVAAVVVAFGVVFTYPVVVPVARRAHPRNLPFFHRMQDRIGRLVITPAGTVVLLAGLYLALAGPWGLREWWVGFGILAIVVILGVGGAFLVPRERRLAEMAERDIAAAHGDDVRLGEEYEALAGRVLKVQIAVAAVVLVTTLLMVLGSRGQL